MVALRNLSDGVRVLIGQVLPGDVRKPHARDAVVGLVEDDDVEPKPSERVGLVGLECGQDVDPALGQDPGIEADPDLGDLGAVYAVRLEQSQIAGRLRRLVAERLALPSPSRSESRSLTGR